MGGRRKGGKAGVRTIPMSLGEDVFVFVLLCFFGLFHTYHVHTQHLRDEVMTVMIYNKCMVDVIRRSQEEELADANSITCLHWIIS
jgi:hypothetical protein